jgi:hypothetical protein
MHRKITDRYPFLMLIETEAGGEGGSAGSGSGEGGKQEFVPITSQEAFDAAIKERIARERSKYADYDDIKAKAAEHDRLIESQKSEAQKAIDAANKKAEEAIKKAAAAEREAVLAKAGVKDEDVALFDGVPADKIPALAAKIAAANTTNQPPAQRGRETFVPGNGVREDVDPDMEKLVKDLF